MLVFDNIVYSLQKSGGVSRFWSKVTEPYLNSAIFVERNDATANIYRQGLSLSKKHSDHPVLKIVSRYVNFTKQFATEPYIFHSSYYRTNNIKGAINVTTVHDLIYERFGSGIGTKLHVTQKCRSLEASDVIVCVSEHTRKDLFDYYPFTKNKRVLVIPNGVDPVNVVSETELSSVVLSAAASAPYFLYVGHRGACKGFDRVYQALAHCPSDWRCIVVGDWLSATEMTAIQSLALMDRVISVGRVSDAALNYLYRHAKFFFFPSLYEGFGIPPLEAMQQGCPVLASNRSSVPEVVGDAGILFDPDDSGSLATGVHILLSSKIRVGLVQKGHVRAAEFTWRRVVDAYRDLYDELLTAPRAR